MKICADKLAKSSPPIQPVIPALLAPALLKMTPTETKKNATFYRSFLDSDFVLRELRLHLPPLLDNRHGQQHAGALALDRNIDRQQEPEVERLQREIPPDRPRLLHPIPEQPYSERRLQRNDSERQQRNRRLHRELLHDRNRQSSLYEAGIQLRHKEAGELPRQGDNRESNYNRLRQRRGLPIAGGGNGREQRNMHYPAERQINRYAVDESAYPNFGRSSPPPPPISQRERDAIEVPEELRPRRREDAN